VHFAIRNSFYVMPIQKDGLSKDMHGRPPSFDCNWIAIGSYLFNRYHRYYLRCKAMVIILMKL